eukprot:1376245-Rhodomonas_salina.1
MGSNRIRIYKHVMDLIDRHSRVRHELESGCLTFSMRDCGLESLHQIASDLDSDPTISPDLSESIAHALDDDELDSWRGVRRRIRVLLWPGSVSRAARWHHTDPSMVRKRNSCLMIRDIVGQRRHSSRSHAVYSCVMAGHGDEELLALSDFQLRRAIVACGTVLILPTEWYPDWQPPPAPEYGWWVQVCHDDHDGRTVLSRTVEPRFEDQLLSPLTISDVRQALQRAPSVVHRWMSLTQMGYAVRRTRAGQTEFFIRGKSHSISNFLPPALLSFQRNGHPPTADMPGIYHRMLRRRAPRRTVPVHAALALSTHDMMPGTLGFSSRFFRPASQYRREAFGHLDGAPQRLNPDLVTILSTSQTYTSIWGDMTATVSSGLALITRKPDSITLEGARWYDLKSRHPNLDTFDSLRSHCNTTCDMEQRGYRTLHWSLLHHAQIRLGITASIGDSAITAFPNFEKGLCVADGYRWGPSLTLID